MKRYAIIFSDSPQIDAYMPGNYSVIWRGEYHEAYKLTNKVTVIAGEDNAGWTLDDYVLPRLASGMYYGEEIDLSHPVMKLVPDSTVTCIYCDQVITQASDGAWEDSSGACGCGTDEHSPS